MMIDEAILQRYMEESSMRMNEKSQYQVYTNLKQLFGGNDIPLEQMKKQDFVDIFSKQSISSSSTFYPYKSKMLDFLIWMKEEGYASDEPLKALQDIRFEDISRAGIYDAYYFADYNDLFQAMEVITVNRNDFETFKVAATLVWLGITLDDAVDVLKADFDEEAGTIQHPRTHEMISLPPIAVGLFTDYKNAVSFESGKFSGTLMYYKQSDYLLRSYRSEHLTKKNVSRAAVTINQLAEKFDKHFRFVSIYLSGIYYRLHEYETEHGRIGRTNAELLAAFFGTTIDNPRDRNTLATKYDEYCDFRDYIYT